MPHSTPRLLSSPCAGLPLVVGLAALLPLAACAPDFADPADAELATTSGAETTSSGPTSAGLSTVTGLTTTATEGDTSEGATTTSADAIPQITAFTLDGIAGSLVVDRAGVATLEVVTADDLEIERVRIVDGEEPLMTLDGPPFRATWVIDDVTAATPRTLRAIAEDAEGRASAPVALDVDFDLPPAGDLRWRDGGSLLHAGEARGLLRDGDAIIAVGARSLDPGAAESHALLRIYDAATGDLQINAAHPKPGTPATFRANAVARLPTGAIAVAGAGTPPGEATTRPWVALFEPSGALVDERLDADAGGEALAIVAGAAAVVGAGGAGGDRAFLRRSAADLATLWEIRDDDPAHTRSELVGLVRGEDGDVYATGTVVGVEVPARVYAARVSPAGAQRWGGRIDCEGIESDHGRAIALGEGGDLLIAAAMVTDHGLRAELRWLDPASGAHLGAALLPSVLALGDEVPGGVAVDRHGRVYLSATASSAAGVDAVVYKRSSDGGAVLWERLVDSDEHGDDRGLAVTVGDDGLVVVGGTLSGEGWPRWWVQAFEP